MQKTEDTWVWSLGREDPLEGVMATHSSILAGESHRQRSLVGYSVEGHKEPDMTEVTEPHVQFSYWPHFDPFTHQAGGSDKVGITWNCCGWEQIYLREYV